MHQTPKTQPSRFQDELLKCKVSSAIHDPASARTELETIIPAEKLEAALKDPWIEKALKANLDDYRMLSSRDVKMPKVLIKGERTLHGLARSTEQFVEIIKKELELP